MTDLTMQSMGRDPQVLSRRLAAFLKTRTTAKGLSEKIGCDVRTAENIRDGKWPIARHWLGISLAFGRDVTDAVFHPEAAAARLAQEIAELADALAAKEAELRQVGGLAPRLAEVRHRLEDRPAELTDAAP